MKNPSAFIPFCGFGGNSEVLGKLFENFSLPICSSFEPIILNDEVCYELNIEERFPNFAGEDLQSGLLLLIDLNEDRQFHSPTKHEDLLNDNDIIKQLSAKADEAKMKIYIRTIGPFTTLLPTY